MQGPGIIEEKVPEFCKTSGAETLTYNSLAVAPLALYD